MGTLILKGPLRNLVVDPGLFVKPSSGRCSFLGLMIPAWWSETEFLSLGTRNFNLKILLEAHIIKPKPLNPKPLCGNVPTGPWMARCCQCPAHDCAPPSRRTE